MDVAKSAGRQTKMNEDQIDQVAAYALEHNFATNNDIIQYIREQQLPSITANTVSNYLKRKGVRSRIAAEKPNLTDAAMANRLEASLSNSLVPNWVWQRTVFIDEFSIDSRIKRKTRVKRLRGERAKSANINRYELRNPKSFSFVCCFTYTGVGPIKLINGRFSAEKYLEYLRDDLLPYYSSYFDDLFWLLHDNARVHTATIVRDFLADQNCRVHTHPPYSPDLNPIENLGNTVKKRFYDRFKSIPPNSNGHLFQIIVQIWQELDNQMDLIHSLVNSMCSRYAECIRAAGDSTRY